MPSPKANPATSGCPWHPPAVIITSPSPTTARVLIPMRRRPASAAASWRAWSPSCTARCEHRAGLRGPPWKSPCRRSIASSVPAVRGRARDEPSGKGKRELPRCAAVGGDEIPDMLRHRLAVDVAARLNLGGDLRRYVFGPVLQRVESNHPHRIVELAQQEIADHGLEVGALEFGLAVDGVQRAKAVDDEIDGLIGAIGHDPG